ncbi:MAG: dienelactone hydrolase family protein [Polyangiaceae bacterium]|nr:dienelactone hydrolase family protein [Polyangiaceae bacterium]MCW5791465.1 dienelactone hydrolase family protein [Polyangiaceae bacterium]
MGESIEFKRPDGGSCPAYETGDAELAVILLQEWWGLNPQIKGLADRLAGEGFRVLVPDLFRGKVTTDADEANHLMTGLDFMDATTQDIQGAASYLRERAAKVAVMGFCMGGALTLLSSAKVDGVDAGVCLYGIPPAEALDPSTIRVPLSCHFGTKDYWCTPDVVKALTERLEAGSVSYELFNYEADHAFMNEARPEVYDRAAAELAWQRSVDFLRRVL